MKFQVGDVLLLQMLPNGWYNNYIGKDYTRECKVIKVEYLELWDEYHIYFSTEYGAENFSLHAVEEMLIDNLSENLENV